MGPTEWHLNPAIEVSTLYARVLLIHSWFRWLALGFAVASTINSLRDTGPLTRKPKGSWIDTLFMMALDLQVLFGFVLYFGLSPFTRSAFPDLGAALGDPSLRFWTFTHVGIMLAANVTVRVGRVLALTATTTEQRRRRRTVWFAITVLIMIAGTPWPGLSNGRPLLRF
jgi:hypothetical protein